MATIIYCDRIRHIAEESRSEVLYRIESAQKHAERPFDEQCSQNFPYPKNFVFFTLANGDSRKQVALNISQISSVEAFGEDVI